MLNLPYLSPSSIALWQKNQEEFYVKYASKRPREPQTDAMSVGSAFDTFIKAELGQLSNEERADLYVKQVEPQWREQAEEWGEANMSLYRECGALDDLRADFKSCGGTGVKLDIEGDITANVGGVPMRGKPDIVFTSEIGHGILDWKVNGYLSKWGASPKAGYLRLRGGKGNGGCHKNVIPVKWRNDIIIGGVLEHVALDWAQQLAIYGWLSGFPIGEEFLVCIDQLVWRKGAGRVAEFRCVISPEWQRRFYEEICTIWEIVTSDHVFRSLSKQESQEREGVLSLTLSAEDLASLKEVL